MKSVQFKTNIKCNGCIAAVTPHLENIEGLESWEVDLGSPDRVLTVEIQDEEVEGAVEEAVREAGYKLEALEEK